MKTPLQNRRLIQLLAFCLTLPMAASAGQGKSRAEEGRYKKSVQVNAVFSQIIRFTLPGEFVQVTKQVKMETNGPTYVAEFLPLGETLDDWRQLIYLSGTKDLVTVRPGLKPKEAAIYLGQKYSKFCNHTFMGTSIGPVDIAGSKAHAVLSSCGRRPVPGGSASESRLIISIQGDKDYYALEWVERGPATDKLVEPDWDKWTGRLESLKPLLVCPMTSNESSGLLNCALKDNPPPR